MTFRPMPLRRFLRYVSTCLYLANSDINIIMCFLSCYSPMHFYFNLQFFDAMTVMLSLLGKCYGGALCRKVVYKVKRGDHCNQLDVKVYMLARHVSKDSFSNINICYYLYSRCCAIITINIERTTFLFNHKERVIVTFRRAYSVKDDSRRRVREVEGKIQQLLVKHTGNNSIFVTFKDKVFNV